MFVCYRSAHQYIFLKANCNVASLKTPFMMGCAPHAAGLGSKAGGWWQWRGLASSAAVQPALPVYRTLRPRPLCPRPPSSFLIVFLKSCGNHSLWKRALAFQRKKISSIFCQKNCKFQLSVSKGRFSRGELSCSRCIPPPSLPHQLSANAARALGRVTGSARASSPAVAWASSPAAQLFS